MALLIRPDYLLMATDMCDVVCQKTPTWRERFPSPRQSLDGAITIWSVMADMTDDAIHDLVAAGATPCSLTDIRLYLDRNMDQWERQVGATNAPVTRPTIASPAAPVTLTVGLAPIQRWTIGDSSHEPLVLVAFHGRWASVVLSVRHWALAVKRALLAPVF